jgi:hypothetical protein
MHIYLRATSVGAVAAALCIAAASPAFAQQGQISATKESDAIRLIAKDAAPQEAADRAIVKEQGPTDRGGFSPTFPTLQLLATTGEKEVSLGIGFSLSNPGVDPSNSLRRSSRTTRFSFTGFAPIDKDKGERFVNLAKPLSGSRLKIGVVHYFSNYTIRQQDINTAVTEMNRALDNCVRRRVSAWALDKPEASRQLAANYVTRLTAETATRGETEQALTVLDADAAFSDLTATAKSCRVGEEGGFKSNEQLVTEYGNRDQIRASIRAATASAPTYFFGGDTTLGRNGFSYLDRTAFVIEEKEKGEYEFSAFAGVIGGSGTWSLRGGVSHSLAYDPQDEIQLCQTTPTPGQTQCLTGADGAPARTKRTVITMEGRTLFRLAGTNARIGIAPEFAFDPDNSEYSIDVPIYFAPGEGGRLTGGVRVGYASEKKDLSFGLFVGVPFTVFQ